MQNKVFRILVGTFCAAWLIKELIVPITTASFLSHQYMSLVTKCDSAMEASWYGDEQSAIERKAQEIHLLDCHDYDKTRKVLLMAGLPETYLSWLGLKALELYQRPASELTAQHRFKER